ncbi:MAG: Isoprenyl transferase [Parcubacteria group bacterium GW2011_GWF1_40_6]|uniref:Isoprenyl transferase n=2 Tax=Candidatus Nomuraibacteriota TaxID=1752729 RepID=A0A0G0QS94_9BACT|nr:MAG: Isoprenyl transferase [Candidatus Nomurabacteria bacterium GW2011_GWF2_40_12]KKR69739.1 MAG: Isoprenyl transferase [Parcubacteria group bacterium GW2011_GWF1_40_6]OGJ10060.1 MAG: di-trans,poly-cis-decaprenylcistransferase [Candidatus Nomurabacteria bacterium RIFOXYB1_FULL_39_16]OGJ15494.1 MAG: di-trans,poly-cis-decaprenylcistransferase [Candidatus Nomurabacteria bacterium RIFOXYD1_FULL_39_12]
MAIEEIKDLKKPKCVGIIMDGNRRWAKQRNLPSFEGHKIGYNKVKEIADWCIGEKIPNLIVYAFSIENWKRSKEEVSYLMNLIKLMVDKDKDLPLFKEKGARVSFVGDMSLVSEDLKRLILKAEEETIELKKLHTVIAFSYGGRREILNAAKEISKIKDKKEIESMTEEEFSKFLWTNKIGVPDPDIIIRTSGEMRLSNFLTWQSVYSELFFTKTYWPDFSYEEFKKILDEFSFRERRLGK